MNEDISVKLWVVNFCVRIVYPKYNHYTFLVFLAIKFRILWNKTLSGTKGMDTFGVKTIPSYFSKYLLKDEVEDYFPVVVDKCVIISREQYIQLCCENLFYKDNGVLWLAMKLSPESKKKLKDKQNTSKKQSNLLRYNLKHVTSEIHKKLWVDGSSKGSSLDNVRIVPVVGSKQVLENTAFTTENEFHNISSSFDLKNDSIEVTFHPIPSIDYSPKIATTAELNLFVTENDLLEFTKEVLSNYFEEPKLISVNDVFSIDVAPDIVYKYNQKYLQEIPPTVTLYFKCKHLTCDTEESEKKDEKKDNIVRAYFIVKGVTQLSLGDNIHILKPKDTFYKIQDYENKYSNVLHACPTGIKQTFDQMQETMRPFLNGDINDLASSLSSPIIPMLLLTGSLGSGRHLIVKTLAKCNGLACLSIDCNAIQSSTAKQTESKIYATIQKAKTYAPVIVLLDNFETSSQFQKLMSYLIYMGLQVSEECILQKAKQTESKIYATIQKAKTYAPVIVLLDNFEVFAVDPENNEDCRVIEHFMNTITDLYQNYTKHLIFFIAITERQDLKPNILRLFLEKIHISKLNSQQRYDMLEWFTRAMQLNVGEDEESIKDTEGHILNESSKEVLQRVAAKTETFLYGDLDTLLHFAMRESYLKQHNKYNQLPPDPDLKLVKEEDFNSALESMRSLQSQHLDAPKIPKVYWDDIGGLDKLKKELLKTIEFPIKYPHLFKNSSLKRSGILMYGPPGCGKTLVAKAVSTELNVSFMSVKGPELLNMYIGQSEENVRKVFESARASSPCIVFLDELDALAPRRGAAGDSGGASDRVVSQLLAELDGVASSEDADSSSFVFVMGATNRPDLLEQSLLRPGRLDKMIYVGPYCGQQEKTSVLKALCRKSQLRPEVNLEAVSAALPERCTGADLMSVVGTARAAAVRAVVHRLHSGLIKESELSPDSVILGVSELLQGVESFRPSVTEDELAYYESLQSNM